MEYLKIEECKQRKIYRLQSRNLAYGVFDGKNGFIGIRSKFGHEYLFTEYHYDADPHYGTVRPIEEVGELREWVPLQETLATVCRHCGRPVIFVPDGEKPTPGTWKHVPWSKYDEELAEIVPFDFGDCKASPVAVGNSYLFDYLDALRKELG